MQTPDTNVVHDSHVTQTRFKYAYILTQMQLAQFMFGIMVIHFPCYVSDMIMMSRVQNSSIL